MVRCASDSGAESLLASHIKRGPTVAGELSKFGLWNLRGHDNYSSRDGLVDPPTNVCGEAACSTGLGRVHGSFMIGQPDTDNSCACKRRIIGSIGST